MEIGITGGIMIKLLTIQSELKSAKNLEFETFTYVGDKYIEDFDKDIIVRWGSSYLGYDKNGNYKDYKNVINTSKAINFNCRKNEALEAMSRVVNTPKIYKHEVPANQLAVYRPTEHSSGKGFSVKKGPFLVKDYYYATEWIDTEVEYRVWFCGDAMLWAQRTSVNKKRLSEEYKCRSLWPYTHKGRVPTKLKEDVLKAKNAIGLEVGAADILYKDKKYYFLENNSAPTIDSNKVMNFYKNNLVKMAKTKFHNLI